MKTVRNTDRIGKETTVCEGMTVLHSVTLSGAPLDSELRLEYLRGDGPDVLVQTTTASVHGGEPANWDLAAIVNADFNSGKLDSSKLKSYAADALEGSTQPVIAFRRLIIENAEHIMQPERRAPREQVVHSNVRHT